jgi:hypothetical protein
MPAAAGIVAAGQATAGSRRRQHEEIVDGDAGMTARASSFVQVSG